MLKGTPTLFELIANADVYAPEPLGINNVLVCGNKVVYVGPRLPQLDDCLDVNLTDVDGARLIPGLIDGHAHVTGGGGEAGPSTRVPPLPLSSFTGAGVTSVIGLLGTDDLTRTPQTLLTHVYGLREEGLSAWCYTGGYHIPAVTLTHSLKSDIVNLEPVNHPRWHRVCAKAKTGQRQRHTYRGHISRCGYYAGATDRRRRYRFITPR